MLLYTSLHFRAKCRIFYSTFIQQRFFLKSINWGLIWVSFQAEMPNIHCSFSHVKICCFSLSQTDSLRVLDCWSNRTSYLSNLSEEIITGVFLCSLTRKLELLVAPQLFRVDVSPPNFSHGFISIKSSRPEDVKLLKISQKSKIREKKQKQIIRTLFFLLSSPVNHLTTPQIYQLLHRRFSIN